MPAVNQLRFVAVGQDDPLAEPLLAELAVEYATRYGGADERVVDVAARLPGRRVRAAGRRPADRPARRQPVTGGAFRRFDAETAELKRIWTDSRHRRRGPRQGAAGRTGGRDRRARLPARLPDDR